MNKQLRIIPLGGLGEIGKNMTVLEYGHDMLIVDCGVMFPDNDMYGIDLVLPQFDYVLQNRSRIRGVVITHGHMDHIGGLPFLMRDLRATVYGTTMTIGMIKRQLEEAGVLGSAHLNTIRNDERLKLGVFTLHAFPVAHSIPGSVGLVIETPVGAVVHTGDYKLDETPTGGQTTDLGRLRALTPHGVLALLGDSTNADRPGHTPTEQTVADELDRLFIEAKNRRIIIATFASLLARLREIMVLAHKHGRHVALTGRSLEQNIDLARELGYIKVPDSLIVPVDSRLPDHKMVILSTGSQGEPRSALNRMATGEHRQIQVKRGDMIIISGGTIPGNEGDVGRMLDKLFARGASVIYGRLANIHVSGHGSRDEMAAMLKATRPKFLIPVHGETRHLHLHGELAESSGMRPDQVFILDNGVVFATDGKRAWREAPVPANDVLVDGRLIGELGEPELRDRQRLSQEGFIVALIPVDSRDRLAGDPELISRGFMPAHRSERLLQAARNEIKRRAPKGSPVKAADVQLALQDLFYRETQSRPVVLPSLVRVGPIVVGSGGGRRAASPAREPARERPAVRAQSTAHDNREPRRGQPRPGAPGARPAPGQRPASGGHPSQPAREQTNRRRPGGGGAPRREVGEQRPARAGQNDGQRPGKRRPSGR
jgi:ribonuclease J